MVEWLCAVAWILVEWLPVVVWLGGCWWLPGQVVARGCLVKWLFLKVMQEQRVGAEESINLQIIFNSWRCNYFVSSLPSDPRMLAAPV